MNEFKEEIVKQEVNSTNVSETVVVRENKLSLSKLIVYILVLILSVVFALIMWFAIKMFSERMNDGSFQDKTVYVGNPKNYEFGSMTITMGDKFSTEILDDEVRIFNDYYNVKIKIVYKGFMDEFSLSSFIMEDLPQQSSKVYKNKGGNEFYYSTVNIGNDSTTDIYIQNNNDLYNIEITSNKDIHFITMFVQWANSIAFEN